MADFVTSISIETFGQKQGLKKQLGTIKKWYKASSVRILRISYEETTINITYIPVNYQRKVFLDWDRGSAYKRVTAWSDRHCRKNDCSLSEVSVISLPADSRKRKTFYIATAFAEVDRS